MSDKVTQYFELCQTAQSCRRCSGVLHDFAFLNANNGNIRADLVLVGEAPGTARAENTGRADFKIQSFHGNKTGDNFEHLLTMSEIERDKIFVTNVLLHSPIKENGQMRAPNEQEVFNCQDFLRMQLWVIKPKIVATLGSFALKALTGQNLSISKEVAKPRQLEDFWLFPLYHSSPNVTSTWRTIPQQIEDYKELRKFAASKGANV